MMAFLTYDEATQYFREHWIGAFIIVGFMFVALGWLVSYLMRPSILMVEKELQKSERRLATDLSESEKFNEEYKAFAKDKKERHQIK